MGKMKKKNKIKRFVYVLYGVAIVNILGAIYNLSPLWFQGSQYTIFPLTHLIVAIIIWNKNTQRGSN